jgi:apolipoprotein N-acyltransferase
MWALSYLGSTWVLILVIALVIAALGALAWFSHNWKLIAAAVLILAVGFAYMHVDKQAYARRVAEESAAQVTKLQGRIKTLNEASEADAKRAAENADRISKLESQVNDTPPNAQRCLDRAGAGRVRNIK